MHAFLERIYSNLNKVATALNSQKPRDWSKEQEEYNKNLSDINNNTKDINYINLKGMNNLSPETKSKLLEEQKSINKDKLDQSIVNKHLQDIKPDDPNMWWDQKTKTVMYNDPVTGKVYNLSNDQLRRMPWYQKPEAYKMRNAPAMPKFVAEQLAYNEKIDNWLNDDANTNTNTNVGSTSPVTNTPAKPTQEKTQPLTSNTDQSNQSSNSNKNFWGLTQEQQENLNRAIRSQGAILNEKDVQYGIPANMEETNIAPFTSGLRFKDMGQFWDIQKQQSDYQQSWRKAEAYKNLEKYNKQLDNQINQFKKALNNPNLSASDKQKIQSNINTIERRKQILRQRFKMQLAQKQ